MTNTTKCTIETRNIDKIYQNGGEDLKVLDNINLKVYEGSFIAILDPSGQLVIIGIKYIYSIWME